MKSKIEDKILDNIKGDVLELGFDIEYIEFVKEGTQNILRVVLDNPKSTISIEDCEKVSRSIEEKVDKYINIEYTLEVSSPGLERQLKNINLYEKYVGSEVYLKVFKDIGFGKEITAILKNVNKNDNTIVIEIDDKDICLNIKDIATAHTVYDFSKVLKENDRVNINELKKF